jgi:nucleotidyltransferase substrate binding protein (TIGR01987 family)
MKCIRVKKDIDTSMNKLGESIVSLEAIYLKPNQEDRVNIDATIRRFYFTFELFWKTMKTFLNKKGVEVYYPKDVLKEAYASHFLEDEAVWRGMIKDRNLTSHTYDEALADEIFNRMKLYVPVFRQAFDKLSETVVDE